MSKGGAKKAIALADETEDLVYFMQQVVAEMEIVLAKTPDMLPVLKEAGVVDSGGQGLVEVFHGLMDALEGKEIDYSIEGASMEAKPVKISAQTEAEIKFGYCTEFIIMLEKEYTMDTELEFKAFLESIGDSIVVVSDDDIVKIHVHTNDPGLALQKALTFGSLTKIKIDNMREEHEEKLIKEASKLAEEEAKKAAEAKKAEPRKEMGFISVSIGEGVGEIFKGLGVDYLIEGGQTMIPSTEDMLNAIDNVNAEHIFILPNNKNIILAANQAQALTEDKVIHVIPTKTVPQGITAMINFLPDLSAEENVEAMTEAITTVKTGQVTYAVRDTKIDDKEIHEGNIMGIGDSGILAVGEELEATTLEMFKELVDDMSEIISIYYGEEVDEAVAEELGEKVGEMFPECDVEVHFGGQPIYYYVVSVE